MSQVAEYEYRITVEFDYQGGSGTKPGGFGVLKTSTEDSVEVSFIIPQGNVSKTGYMFAGWKFSVDEQTYNVNDPVTFTVSKSPSSTSPVIETTVKFYAQWSPKRVQISYLHGSQGTGDDSIVYSNYGNKVQLADALFTKIGFRQIGWAKTDNASTSTYNLNAEVVLYGNLTLYPVFKAWSSSIASITSNVAIKSTGGTGTLSITRYSSSYNHRVEFTFGNANPVIYTNVDTTLSFTLPYNWLAQLPNTTSGTARCTVKTFSGSTLIGSPVYVDFVASVHSSVKPFPDVSLEVVNNNSTVAGWGIALQSYSKVKISWGNSVLPDYTTIKNVTVTGESLNYSGTGSNATSGTIMTDGQKTYTLKITDSRGRYATASVSVNVVRYYYPAVDQFYPYRSDSSGHPALYDGTYIGVFPSSGFAPCNGHNDFFNAVIEYKKSTSSSWILATNYAYNTLITFGGGNITITDTWDVRYTVTDTLGNSTVVTRTIPPIAGVSFGLNGGCARFGGPVRYSDRFECDWDVQFDKGFDLLNNRASENLSSAGWYRVVSFDATASSNPSWEILGGPGVSIDFTITRYGATATAETHKITMFTYYAGIVFDGELSRCGTILIDKIRYTYGNNKANVDIHYTGTGSNRVTVYWEPHTPSETMRYTRLQTENFTAVSDAPSGETVVTPYVFNVNGAKFRKVVTTSTFETPNGAIGSTVVSNLGSNKTISNNTNTQVLSLSLPAGTWVVVGKARFSANATGYRRCNISTTNAADAAHVQVPAVNGAVTQLTVTKIMTVSDQTTIYLNAYQNSGSSLTMGAGSDGEINALSAVRIA